MAGLFMFLAFALGLLGLLGLLGFDLGSQSLLPLLPSELHLGIHLGFLRFRLSSTWDSILDPLVSILELLLAGSGKVFLSTSDTQIVQT